MLDLLNEIWGSLRRNKMRTAATGIAVASGIFLLIVLLGASNGIIHTLQEGDQGLGLDAIHVWPGTTSKPYQGLKEGRTVKLDQDDRTLTERQFATHVAATSAKISQDGQTASVGKNHLSVSVEGVYPACREVEVVKLLRGRFINELDIARQRKVVVMAEDQEEHLFGRQHSGLGRHVKINGIMFLVVGITKKDYGFNNNGMFVPFTTASTIYGHDQTIDQLSIKARGLDTKALNEQFEQEFRQAMGLRHEFAPDDHRALWIWSTAEDNASMNQAFGVLHTSFWILGLLTLLSGVVGVSNIMLIAVKERTHEFGIRKAIGARPWGIIRMVMLESVLITTLFGYVGMVLGVAFCQWMDATVGSQTVDMGIIQQKVFVDPTVDLATCIQATVVMVVAGALAGFFPARRAAHIKPIEALRG